MSSALEPTDLGDLVEVAGVSVAFDRRWRWLEPLRSGHAVEPPPGGVPDVQADEQTAADGWIGAEWRRVRVDHGAIDGATVLSIDVAEIGCVSVLLEEPSTTTPWIAVEPLEEAPLDPLAEAALGPGLVLALAARDRWCLHAGAVVCDGQAIVFLGESGAGKSTMARHLAGSIGTRLADDVLPIQWCEGDAGGGPRAWATFPQLKLTADEQPVVAVGTEPVPIGAIYRLQPAEPDAEPGLSDLSSSDATLAIVRHTVAGRLFAAKTLRRHLDESAKLAAAIPVRELVVPRRLESLDAVATLIAPS